MSNVATLISHCLMKILKPREKERHGQGHTVNEWQNWGFRSDLRYTPNHLDLADLRHIPEDVLRRAEATPSDCFSCQMVF